LPRPAPRAALVTALVSLALAAGSAPAAAGPVATVAAACHVSQSPNAYGTTYLFALRVSGTSCTNGKKVVRGFNACRHRHGKAGRCGGVFGYRCVERRYAKLSTSYDALVKCAKGGKLVRFRYEQFT
jgi:hypothetical protein